MPAYCEWKAKTVEKKFSNLPGLLCTTRGLGISSGHLLENKRMQLHSDRERGGDGGT